MQQGHEIMVDAFSAYKAIKKVNWHSNKTNCTSERAGIPNFCMSLKLFNLVASQSIAWLKKTKLIPSRCLNSFIKLSSSHQQTTPKEGCNETHLSCAVGSTAYFCFIRKFLTSTISLDWMTLDSSPIFSFKNIWNTWKDQGVKREELLWSPEKNLNSGTHNVRSLGW